MDLHRIDSSATRGQTLLHRCSAVTKLVAFALVLASVIVSVNLLLVLGIAAVLLATIVGLRLPMRPMLSLAAYPFVFAAFFALAAAPSFWAGALIVAKAVTAALASVLLLFTTPYPQIFAPLQRVLPPLIGDALLMTYRSLFLLLERFDHLLTAARLRAGLVTRDPVRSARAITSSLGGVLLYSVDLSQRTYDVMHLRGYDKRLRVSLTSSAPPAAQALVVAAAAALILAAGTWRLGGAQVAPFAWIPLSAGLIVLALVLLARALSPERAR